MISVAIVTANRSMRSTWSSAVKQMRGGHCLGAYPSTDQLIRLVESSPPDIIVLGLEAEEESRQAIRQLQDHFPTAQVLILAAILNDEQLFATLRAGVQGYLQQSVFPTHLQSAISELYQGGTPLSKGAARRILAAFRVQQHNDNLSEREQEVHQLMCEGKNYREIAEALFVSQNTVRFHLKNIYKKLGVKSRHEAIARAYESGLM